MKILIVSNLYPPIAFGGYEVECAGVVERLREHHDVRVLTSRPGGAEVPDDPEIWREVSLNIMQRVEHHHARRDRNFVVHCRSAAGIAAEHSQDCFSHR